MLIISSKLLKGITVRYSKKIIISVLPLVFGIVSVASAASADSCGEYTEAPSSYSPEMLTIIDTEVGTDAYQRLVTYSNGGHKAIGMAIAGSYDYFGQCQFVGIGIMDGSGGNGYRPNYTLAIWHEGINLNTARSVVYALIGASAIPVVTNGDCNISCDGTTGRQFDGTITNESTATTTTIQQVASMPPIVSETTLEESVGAIQEHGEPLGESTTTPVIIVMDEETTTTTTTIVPVLTLINYSEEITLNTITKKLLTTNKKKIKKLVVRRKR